MRSWFTTVLATWSFCAAAQGWVPNETLVSPSPDLIDLEYSPSRAMYARVDLDGMLWVGRIDPATGDFLQPDGRETAVDALAQTIGDGRLTFTGPEWVTTPEGDQVVYTRFPKTGFHSAANARLGAAKPDAAGTWSGASLGPDVPRYGPFGSKTGVNPRGLITYVDNAKNKLYRELGDPATEAVVPGTAPGELNGVNIVNGAHALVYRLPVGSVWQAFRYDIDSHVLEQLTFDAGEKQTLWMWRAPEFDDFELLALVDQVELRAYRRLPQPDGTLRWTQFLSLTAPPGSTLSSLEYFTWDGRSYAFMEMTNSTERWPSSIWVASLDPAAPQFHRITADTPVRARTDPEVFITSRGPIIYYNRYDPAVNPRRWYCAECSEGVYRADPGLTPTDPPTAPRP